MTRMLVAALVCGAALQATDAQAAGPEKKKKVAVLPFDVAKGTDPQLGKTFAGALLGEVRKQRGADVELMAPEDVVQALPAPLRGRLKRCEMAACKAQMAQAVNADRALGGGISKVGSTVVLNLAVLEAGDGSQVTQWTGKAPEKAIDQLLDQLPSAVDTLFPRAAGPVVAPAPAPVAGATTPPGPSNNAPPVLAAAPAPTVVGPAPVTPAPAPAAPPPGPAANPLPLPPLPADARAPVPAANAAVLPPPTAAPLLPQDEQPPPMRATPPPSAEQLMATMTDPQGAYPTVKAQTANQPVREGPSWSKPLLGTGIGLLVPGLAIGALSVVAAGVGVVASVTSAVAARNINAEVKAVPHKDTGGFPLSRLILLGRVLEATGYLGLGGAALVVFVGVLLLAAFVMAGVGLVVAAVPRGEGQETYLGQGVTE